MAANQFGAKSIGEKDWKPHNINIESNPNAVLPTARARDDTIWKPHNQNVASKPDVIYAHGRVPGPDWTSRIRCLPQSNFGDISTSDNQKEYLTQRQSGRRHFPRQSDVTKEEWSFYPDGYKYGKRCVISGHYHGNKQTVKEIQLEDKMGTKTKVCDPRGGLPVVAPGDKFYSIPEYSVNFYNEGSTIPPVNFSRTNQPAPDTFIPLCSLPRHVSISYKEKEEERKMSEEVKEVCQLDGWMPAPPLNAAY